MTARGWGLLLLLLLLAVYGVALILPEWMVAT